MKYHKLFLTKIRKMLQNFLSVAVVIGALRANFATAIMESLQVANPEGLGCTDIQLNLKINSYPANICHHEKCCLLHICKCTPE